MRSKQDISMLLDELETSRADDLEDQDLDFKQWNQHSTADAVKTVVDWAICMANSGGGTVVFGVRDKVKGRAKALEGVPLSVDLNRLKQAVYDQTDPKLTPVFEELHVPEGTGRLILMQVHPGMPPYTDTKGRGKIRVGKDCQPLTGTLRRRILVESGDADLSGRLLPGPVEEYISAAAMEQLREAAAKENAPKDILRLTDLDLLSSLRLIQEGRITLAGLLTGGRKQAIKAHINGYRWTHLRMQSDTEYSGRMDGEDALMTSVSRIMDRIMADNPVTTLKEGLFHFEYRAYPEIALREALMNAFCHADYTLSSPIMIKQYSQRLEISNPGRFIGGITPDNILHHPPVARNSRLVEALTVLRLVNRSNLGIGRIFEALLIEGKEPPLIVERGEAICLTFLRGAFSPEFRALVTQEADAGRPLRVDAMLIIQHLLRHTEIQTNHAAKLCHRQAAEMREILGEMEHHGYIERGGPAGRGAYWILSSGLYALLAKVPGARERDGRIDRETAKARIVAVLKRRHERGEPGLKNKEVRQITHFDRQQVLRLIRELLAEGCVRIKGRGQSAQYVYRTSDGAGESDK